MFSGKIPIYKMKDKVVRQEARMSVKVDNDGIDKINIEFIQRDLQHEGKSEKSPHNAIFDDKFELPSKFFNFKFDIKKMHNIIISLPDVNPEKVEQIKTEVENGTYTISTERIAERLIEEAMK